jgi:protease secretion system membrane fusion protein
MNTSTPAAAMAALSNPAQAVDAQEIARLRDTRTPVRLGLWVLIVGFGLFLVWAAWAPLGEGVPAPALVSVDNRRTTIQHLQGGVIKAVPVRDGQQVRRGDLLVELDDAQVRAQVESVRQTYLAQRALEGRLLAEMAGAQTISFHPDLLRSTDPLAAQHMAVQARLHQARSAAHAAEMAAMRQAVSGLQVQMQGAQERLVERRDQQALQQRQTQAVRRLADEGFAPRNQALQLEQSQADIRGDIAGLRSELSRLQSSAAEGRQRLLAMESTYLRETSEQLAAVRAEVQANQELMQAKQEELGRMEIRSPTDGQVIGLAVKNPGGVVQPGQPLMDILPLDEPLVLEVKIPPQAIDAIKVGDAVEVRFSAFAATPHLVVMGKLTSLSGDVVTEQTAQGPISHYNARAQLTPEGMAALGGRSMQPGMNAEVLVLTGERSMLDYLLGPLLRRVSTALTER